MIKKRVTFIILFVVLVIPSFSQFKMINPGNQLKIITPKINVTGFAAYYGNADYISVYIKLMYKGRPLSTPIVRLNNSVINNSGNGEYHGALTPYNNIRVGDRLVFTAEFPKRRLYGLGKPLFSGKIILATYQISNIIEWVYPMPNQVINIGGVLNIPLRWNFTGTPKTTELFIKDKATNVKIYSKNINNEIQKISASLLKPGKEYRMGLWAVDPLDNFRISKNCDASSRVVFYFSDIMTFKTGKELRILSPVIRKY